jgi:hypothetical protein
MCHFINWFKVKLKESFIQPVQTYITTRNMLSRKQQRLDKAQCGELSTPVLHIPIHPVL